MEYYITMFKSLTFLILAFIVSPILLAANDEAKDLEPVTLQLKWKPQFQFAGYYAALEHGFYEEEGLDVTIRPLTSDINVIEQISLGEVEYAVGGGQVLLPTMLMARLLRRWQPYSNMIL